jgi:hypothetical protein
LGRITLGHFIFHNNRRLGQLSRPVLHPKVSCLQFVMGRWDFL